MNLLFVVPHLRKGGPVDVLYNICKEILKFADIQVELLTLRQECKKSKISDFRDLGVPIIQLNKSYAFCELLTYSVANKIQVIVDSHQVDLVHAHGYHSVIACKRLKRVKLVSTLHNRATEDYVNVFGRVWGSYMLRRLFSSLKHFNLNIGVSQSVSTLYQNYLPHVSFVNNGIDVNHFYPIEEIERMKMRKKLHLPLDKYIFVSAGRIEKEKHYEELISWFVHNNCNKKAVLLILGNGKRFEKCKELCNDSEAVILPGYVSSVNEYYMCSDFYISNSESEGMSMAVCEGISCGLFPVLSNIPSHRDVGEKVNGLFFNKLSELSLEQVLSVVYEREQLHNYIEDYFSTISMGKGYLDIYRDVERGCNA